MITLHEAIRSVQDELIKSQQEREQKGIPQLFVTEKLTIELSCVFSETDSTANYAQMGRPFRPSGTAIPF